jgi:hypothetical protein
MRWRGRAGPREDIEGFFGDALDWAKGVWGMVNPWSANSLAGRVESTVSDALTGTLSSIEQAGKSLGEARPGWGKAGKIARGTGLALPFVVAGLGQYLSDEKKHPDMTQDRRVAHATGEGLMTGGASAAGAATLGYVGSFAGPEGAVVGAVVGGIGAGSVVDKFDDAAVEGFGEAGHWVKHEAQRFPHQVAGAWHDCLDWASDVGESMREMPGVPGH